MLAPNARFGNCFSASFLVAFPFFLELLAARKPDVAGARGHRLSLFVMEGEKFDVTPLTKVYVGSRLAPHAPQNSNLVFSVVFPCR
jgi:hypothetical protein